MTTSPARLWTEALARLFCSYRLTPVGVPPVAHGPRAHRSISAATEVRRCAVEVVDDPRPSVEAVLAPAFPPPLARVGRGRRRGLSDGGYSGYPPLEPLIDGTDRDGFVVVRIDPIGIAEVPTRAVLILDRMNEVVCKSSLVRELRRIARISEFGATARLSVEESGMLRLPIIGREPAMIRLDSSSNSKLDTEHEALGRARVATAVRTRRPDLDAARPSPAAFPLSHPGVSRPWWRKGPCSARAERSSGPCPSCCAAARAPRRSASAA